MNHKKNYRLYKSRHGLIMGVCKGASEYLGVPVSLIRALAFFSLFFWGPLSILFYFIAGFFLEKEPKKKWNDYDRDFYRRVNFKPAHAVHKVGNDLSKMEDRIQRMEQLVTSKQYALKQKFKELEN